MDPRSIVREVLHALCVLFGGGSCDHCGHVAHCRGTIADTAVCPHCDAEWEAMAAKPGQRAALFPVDGPL